jgi:hypothetical protein
MALTHGSQLMKKSRKQELSEKAMKNSADAAIGFSTSCGIISPSS